MPDPQPRKYQPAPEPPKNQAPNGGIGGSRVEDSIGELAKEIARLLALVR